MRSASNRGMDEHLKSNADPHYDETDAPQNPPNSMMKQSARRGWLASSLGTVLVIFLVVGAVFGWVLMQRSLGSGPLHRSDPRPVVGTSGKIGERVGASTPSGTSLPSCKYGSKVSGPVMT